MILIVKSAIGAMDFCNEFSFGWLFNRCVKLSAVVSIRYFLCQILMILWAYLCSCFCVAFVEV